MVDKKLVAATVRSREFGMQRRINQVTTSSHLEMGNKKEEDKREEKNRIHISFKRKESKRQYINKNKKCKEEEKEDAAAGSDDEMPQFDEKAEAAKKEDIDCMREEGEGKSGSSKISPQSRNEESQRTTFTVLQKNMRSMNSNDRLDELIRELYQVDWDVILISETWRQNKEVWETQQGHIMVESGQFINKHGVAILLNKRWKNQIKWVHCESELIVAMSITVNKHPIMLMSVYMPHSGYADHHVEKVSKTINKILEGEKGMKIVGGDFNAELGPGEGLELSAVGHYTLNKGNCRGEWMTQWLLQNKLMALNTMYKKVPQKQATFYTSKNVGKQLDYILSDKKHYKWSRDAEACDTIHMGSDHRCVKARFEIPNDKEKGKPRKTKAPSTEQKSEKSDDEKQQKYLDLEQRVKAVDSRQTTNESTSEVKDVTTAAISREAKADETEGSRAADASEASAAGEKILPKRQAAAPEGTVASEEQKKKAKRTKRIGAWRKGAKKREGGKGREDCDRCVSSTGSDSC